MPVTIFKCVKAGVSILHFEWKTFQRGQYASDLISGFMLSDVETFRWWSLAKDYF